MAKETNMLAKVGSWAFIIGVVLALIAGIFNTGQANPVVVSVLILLGLIVGFLNVTGRETTPFLLAALSLVLVSYYGGDVFGQIAVTGSVSVGALLKSVLTAIMTFVVPATIIVALKAIYALAHDE